MLALMFTIVIVGCYGNEYEVDYQDPNHQKVSMILRYIICKYIIIIFVYIFFSSMFKSQGEVIVEIKEKSQQEERDILSWKENETDFIKAW